MSKKNKKRFKKGTVNGDAAQAMVPSAGSPSQPRSEGGDLLASLFSGGTGGDLDRQVSPSPSDGNPPRSWSAVDTEASRRYGPGTHSGSGLVSDGSLVAGALARGQANVQRYPNHTVAGALQEAALRHQVTVFGHTKGPQASPEETYQAMLVGIDHDSNPQVFQAFEAALNQMTQAFKERVGRYPTFGVPRDANDLEFQRAYIALRNHYWPSGG